MSALPSEDLLGLLESLGLATRLQVERTGAKAKRLARDLPLFDSVWVDALVSARLLTPYQARCINQGRGFRLQQGEVVLLQPRSTLGYATLFDAREIVTRRPASALVASVSAVQADSSADAPVDAPVDESELQRRLRELLSRYATLSSDDEPVLLPIETGDCDADSLWLAGPAIEGAQLADLLVRQGRFAPAVVLEVARQMIAQLDTLHRHGLIHGDISAAGTFLHDDGTVQLPFAGVRPLLRPHEGYAHSELPPESYDYLAPERIERAAPAALATDLYACGLLWWHMLTGRAPLRGGNSLAKLKAAHEAKLAELRLLAPDTPEPLSQAIAACTQREPERRPDSCAALAALLGPSTRAGRAELAAAADPRQRRAPYLRFATGGWRRSPQMPVYLAAAAGCLLMLLATSWPLWRGQVPPAALIAQGSLHSDPTSVTRATGSSPGSRQSQQPDTQQDAGLLQVPGHSGNWPQEPQGRPAADEPLQIVVPADRPVGALQLDLREGDLVAAPPHSRGVVIIPPEGWPVLAEDVRFERIDFVQSSQPSATSGQPALIKLEAQRASFASCSFQAAQETTHPPIAIRWRRPHLGATESLGSVARLRLQDCVMHGIERGIECDVPAAVLIEADNLLAIGHAGADGALVQVTRPLSAEEPLTLRLTHCAVRQLAAGLHLDCEKLPGAPGALHVKTVQCVFALHEEGALCRFAGSTNPARWLALTQWHGQGTLLEPGIPFAIWLSAGERTVLSEENAVIDGLVASRFEFAGGVSARPADSQLTHWSAPLQSEQAPGIRPLALLPYQD